MDLSDILLLVQPGHDCRSAAGVAAQLAVRHGAQVEGVCPAPLPPLALADCYATGPNAVLEVVERMDRDIATEAAGAEAPARAALEATGCDFTFTVAEPAELPAETALRARLADLVVMTRPGAPHSAALPLAEALIRLGGAPCLLTPEAWDPDRPLDHVVVAWNGSRQAKRAMEDALPLLREARRVSILTVGSAASLEDQLSGLTRHLLRKGVVAEVHNTSKSDQGLGDALLAWCRQQQADLLVMGAFGHAPLTERWFGGVTWTVATTAQLPVLMSC